MKKKGDFVAKMSISLLIVILVINVTAHILIYGTETTSFITEGISELSDIKQQYDFINIYSKFAIVLEVFILLIVITVKPVKFIVKFFMNGSKWKFGDNKENNKSENKGSKRLKPIGTVSPSSKTKTDLDLLYERLKVDKSLKVTDIAKLFNVSEDIVLDWGKILESANLASITYPRFGNAEISINEVRDEKST